MFNDSQIILSTPANYSKQPLQILHTLIRFKQTLIPLWPNWSLRLANLLRYHLMHNCGNAILITCSPPDSSTTIAEHLPLLVFAVSQDKYRTDCLPLPCELHLFVYTPQHSFKKLNNLFFIDFHLALLLFPYFQLQIGLGLL